MKTVCERILIFLFLGILSSSFTNLSYAQLETFSVFFDYGRFGDGCLFPFEPAHPDGLTVSDLELMNVRCHAGDGHYTSEWPEEAMPDPGKYLYATIVAPEGEMLSIQETDSLIITARHIGGSSVLAAYFANGDSTALGSWDIINDRDTYALPVDTAFTTDSLEIRLYGYNYSDSWLIIYEMTATMQATYIRVDTEEEASLPDQAPQIQVYPNPVQSNARFAIDMPVANHAQLTVYDLLGREVNRLVDQWLPSGTHQISWSAANHPNGLYLYRLQIADQVNVGRVTVIR